MNVERASIVGAARGWIGTPYLHQASLQNVGCDCLGLVRGVWRDVVGDEPEAAPLYSASWAETLSGELLLDGMKRHFTPVGLADCLPGDVLAFRFRDHLPARHLAILASDTHMIHAHSGTCVSEVPLVDHWRRRLVAAFAFPGVVG
jgi:NlpC/P60 family putative phage cell wall peptidase